MTVTVEIKLKGINTLRAALKAGTGPTQKTLLQWGAITRSYLQRRYVRNAAGGGDWKPLAESTIRARRRGTGKGTAQILRDTGTMFKVLDPVFTNQPGAVQLLQPKSMAITLGYGGPASHPSARKKRTTIADIAGYHQVGNRRLPKREIVVKPDEATIKLMTDTAAKNFTDTGNGR